MGGNEVLAFTISKAALKMIRAGKATLEKGGVKDLAGKFIELATPVAFHNPAPSFIPITGNPKLAAINLVSGLANNIQNAFIQHSVNVANVKLDYLVRQMGSVMRAMHGIKQIQALTWANTALGLANCGISIVGFNMTLRKLDSVHGQIKEFYNRYQQDRQNDKVEKYYSICLDLKGHLAFLQSLRTSEVFDRTLFLQREALIEKDLNTTHSFLKSQVRILV